MDDNFWIFLVADIIFAVIEIVVVALSINYRHSINSDTPTLNMRQFLSLYRVDPSKWHLEYSGVSYRGNDGHYTYAKFSSYFDYHMYKYLCWRKEIYENKAISLKAQAEFVKQLQSDLTFAREEIDELIKKELKKCGDEETD
jgi:hypothetical protein